MSKIMVAPCTWNGLPRIQVDSTCHMTPGVHPLFHEQKGTTPQRQARLTGGTGLYMNYSIIFTEISFYPETSILLQIIRIIYMTFPELCQNLTDKGGRLPGLALGATIVRLPTDKEKISPIQSLGGSFRTHPPSFPKKGEPWRGGCRTPS